MSIPALVYSQIENRSCVLVRASLNVPIAEGAVESAFRLQQTARTISFLRRRNARIVVIGHLGRSGDTLAPVAEVLKTMFPLTFLDKLTGEEVYEAKRNLQPGGVLLLENTRIDDREYANDSLFVDELAAGADSFVFDDFSVAHRAHASTVGLIGQLPSYAGIRFYEELAALRRITERFVSPAMAILSGAKTETKIPLIRHLVGRYDHVFLGGVIANTFLHQKGFGIGKSAKEDTPIDSSLLNNARIVLPEDVCVTKDFQTDRVVSIADIEKDDSIVDIGDATLEKIRQQLRVAQTVMLNGPTGWYEKGYVKRTLAISEEVKNNSVYGFVGGGDTATVLQQHNRMGDWEFVSTGGGSLLAYFSEEKLPVIEAFERKQEG